MVTSLDEIPKKLPLQFTFRHITNLVQIHNNDVKETIKSLKDEIKTDYDKKRIESRAICAINWLNRYAPADMKFKINEKTDLKLNKEEKNAFKDLKTVLSKKITEEKLQQDIYDIAKKNEIEPKDFFKIAYRMLINKEKGPKLANLILTIGRENVIS